MTAVRIILGDTPDGAAGAGGGNPFVADDASIDGDGAGHGCWVVQEATLFVPAAVVLLPDPVGGRRLGSQGLMPPLAALPRQRMEPERFGRTTTPGMGDWWVKPGVGGGGPGCFDFRQEEAMKSNRIKLSNHFLLTQRN